MEKILRHTLRVLIALSFVSACAAAQTTRSGRDARIISARAGGVNFVEGEVSVRPADGATRVAARSTSMNGTARPPGTHRAAWPAGVHRAARAAQMDGATGTTRMGLHARPDRGRRMAAFGSRPMILGLRLARKQGDGGNQGKNDPGSIGHAHCCDPSLPVSWHPNA